MMISILFFLLIVFVGYAMWTQWSKTDPTTSTPKRVWAALLAALGTLSALIWQAVHGGVTTP